MKLKNKYKVRQKIYSNGELFFNDLSEDFFYSFSECYEFIDKCKVLDEKFVKQAKENNIVLKFVYNIEVF